MSEIGTNYTPLKEKHLLTYSAISAFLDCSRAYYWRYVQQLAPLATHPPFEFGRLIHEALARYYNGEDPHDIIETVRGATPDPNNPVTSLIAHRMIEGYINHYPLDDHTLSEIERQFCLKLTSPRSGRCSRTFNVAGKVDGIAITPEGTHTLIEHKTTAYTNGNNFDQLWSNYQVRFYAHCLNLLDYEITDICYNLLTKPPIRQGKHETLEAFDERLKCFYAGELLNRAGEPYVPFTRTMLLYDRLDTHQVAHQVWDVASWIRQCLYHRRWPQNTRSCHRFAHSECRYMPICESCDNPIIIDNQYVLTPPHEELDLTAPEMTI